MSTMPASFLVLLLLFLEVSTTTASVMTIPIARRSLFKASVVAGSSTSAPPSASDFKALRDGLISKYAQPSGSGSGSRKRASSTVPTTNHLGDVTYTAQIKLGSESQTFDVILDTGSSDTWVASNACRQCTSGPTFTPSTSSSYIQGSKPLSVSYGSGDISGRTGTDKVQLGGFAIDDQTIGVVDVADSFLPGTVSGLMGLAFQRLAKSGGVPWWLRVFSASPAPDQKLYSFWFSRYLDSTAEESPGGQFTIGGLNNTLYTGNVTYTPVSSAIWWTIPLQQMTVGQTAVNVPASGQDAIIDTGTTLVGGPESVLDAVFSQIPGAQRGSNIDSNFNGYYAIPCDSNPTIAFTFSGVRYAFSPIDILFQNIGSISPGNCISSLFAYSSASDPVPAGQPQWIIGDAFLKNVYTVFSLGNGDDAGSDARVGFAKLSNTDGEIGLSGDQALTFSSLGSGDLNGTDGIRTGTAAPTQMGPLAGTQTRTETQVAQGEQGAGSSVVRGEGRWGVVIVVAAAVGALIALG